MEFEKRKIEWIEYDILEDHPILDIRTFLRHGGVSEKKFSSLNVSDKIGDHLDNVKMNRELIREILKTPKLVFANQTHSDMVLLVTKENADKSFNCDALVTNEKNIALAITHADCQALMLFDPEYKVIAAVHAGWRGLCLNIYQKTVSFMVNNFNTRPSNIIACMSPSLCLKHSEFKNYKKEFPKELWSYQKDRFHFDLRQIGVDQLMSAGIKNKNIELANDCSFCNEKDFYSHRREKETGRNCTVICLKE
jgi:polyphenol oxidase